MMGEITPNVFLIGVQKSATTSVYDWMAQHPMVCGPVSMKDTPFFIDDTLFKKGTSFISEVYKTQYTGQKIVLNGSANIIYFEEAIQRIQGLNPKAKLILILRHPVDRAISAYNFSVKRNMEQGTLCEAIRKEPEVIKGGDLRKLSNNTYIDHGMYFRQIQRLYSYFDPSQVLILFFEDVKTDPEKTIEKIFEYIGIDTQFTPSFKTLNKTGTVRYKWIMNLIYTESGVKKWLMKNVIDRLVPYDFKYRAKLFFLNLVTRDKSALKGAAVDAALRGELVELFKDDLEQLEKLLDKDLSDWKK